MRTEQSWAVRTGIRVTLGCAALALAVGVPELATAQEVVTHHGESWTELPEDRWGKLGTRDFGKNFCVTGRWSQVQGAGLVLYRSKADTKRFLRITPGPLKDNLTAGLDAAGKKLLRKRSLVRVFGKANPSGSGTYLTVKFVEKLPDEEDTFQEKLKAAGDDVQAIAALAKDCAERAARYEDAALVSMAQKINRRELQVRAEALGPDDHAARFDLAQRFRAQAKDDASAIGLYSLVYEEAKAPEALRDQAKEALLSLRAVRIRQGQDSWGWVTYGEFKRSEGYLPRKEDGRIVYVRREYAELLEVVEEETKRQAAKIDPPRQNPFKAGQDAKTGKIVRGQTYPEVRTAARAFPRFVYHKVLPWGGGGTRALWTQWVMPDGGRVYFLSIEGEENEAKAFPPSEVIGRRPAGTPWPEN
tara:strand:- start:269 stop:1516 length:1248 start_codon:yes stop_codon:yes gene_type:complete